MNSEQFQGFLADDFDYHRLTPEQYMHVLSLKHRCCEIFAAIKSNERATEDIRSRCYQYYPEAYRIIPKPPPELYRNNPSQLPGINTILSSKLPAMQTNIPSLLISQSLESLYAKIQLLTVYHASICTVYNLEISRETQLFRAIRDTNFDPVREQNSIRDKLAQAELAESERKLTETKIELANREIQRAQVKERLSKRKCEELARLKQRRMQRHQRTIKRTEKYCNKIMEWNRMRF